MSKLQHEVISHLAHELWEESGKPQGRDLDFWLEAEKKALTASSNFRAPAVTTAPLVTSRKQLRRRTRV